jgi:hypothetical protein
MDGCPTHSGKANDFQAASTPSKMGRPLIMARVKEGNFDIAQGVKSFRFGVFVIVPSSPGKRKLNYSGLNRHLH